MQYLLTVPEELSQETLQQIVLGIGGELSPIGSPEGYYLPSEEELHSLERGLSDLALGRLTSHEELMRQCAAIGL